MARSPLSNRGHRLLVLLALAALTTLLLLTSFPAQAQTSFSLPAPIGGTTSSASGSASATATTTSGASSSSVAATSTASSTSPAQPTSTAGAGNSTTKATFCPGMLLPNTDNLTISTCANGCCIPCPAVDSFYAPGKVEGIMNDARITRYVSLSLNAFMTVSFLILPGKREQPYLSILFVAMTQGMMYVALAIIDNKDQMCKDKIQSVTAANSTRCVVQSFGIIYFTQCATLWVVLLILKLHLLAVWRSNFIDRHFKKLAGVCFFIPLCFALPVVILGLAENPGIGGSCITSTKNVNTFLFYPLATYMYPSMVLHFWTVVRMVQYALMTSNNDTGMSQLSSSARMKITSTMQVKRLLRGQWRPALMLVVIMATMTVFWLFYFIDAHKLATVTPTTDWFQKWVLCLASQTLAKKSADDAQAFCASVAASSVPSLVWFRAAETLLGLLGVTIFIVFASKTEFWSEWYEMLISIFTRGKTTSRRGPRSRNGSSSPTTSDSKSRQNQTASRMGRNNSSSVHNQHFQQAGHVKQGGGDFNQSTGGGYNGGGGKQELETQGGQWYDMDDLLDKETKSTTNLTRNQSFGSRAGMMANSNNYNSHEPPYYTDNGDLLYRPPVQQQQQQQDTNYGIQKPQRIYDRHMDLIAETGSSYDAYMDQPVVPQPVPRTPKMQSQNIYLSNPEDSTSASPVLAVNSPTAAYPQQVGSLQPMPVKSQRYPDSSSHHQQPSLSSTPLPGYSTPNTFVPPPSANVSSSLTASSSSSRGRGPYILTPAQPISADLNDYYNLSSDSNDRIMRASREPVGGSRSQQQQYQQQQYQPQVYAAGSSSSAAQRSKSPPPPNVPAKNPTRMNQNVSGQVQMPYGY